MRALQTIGKLQCTDAGNRFMRCSCQYVISFTREVLAVEWEGRRPSLQYVQGLYSPMGDAGEPSPDVSQRNKKDGSSHKAQKGAGPDKQSVRLRTST